MGQVPYAIVGNGKVAGHIRRYFSFLGVPYRNWPHESTDECEIVLVLISDSAIENFIVNNRNKFSGKRSFVHFSGSLYSKHAIGLHPLMTFNDKPESYSLETYKNIVFVGEKGNPAFSDIFPDLPNRYVEIEAEKKPLYHALCVISGNFTSILWQEVIKAFKDLQLPPNILNPYMNQIFENLAKSPSNSLTGPLDRKDEKTIKSNLAALEGMPLENIYQAFLKLKGIS
ncbi:MAG: DUF2520 domain-containing protein [Candidatus Rifleibacteriota bacterium]